MKDTIEIPTATEMSIASMTIIQELDRTFFLEDQPKTKSNFQEPNSSLRKCHIVDTRGDEAFERYTNLATRYFKVKIFFLAKICHDF